MSKPYIKIILILLTVLIAVGLNLNDEFSVSRSILINATPKQIHLYVNDLRKWPDWTPWEKAGKHNKIIYGDLTSGVGASQKWKNEQGSGRLNITASAPDNGIAYDIYFDDAKIPSISAIQYEIQSVDVTRVTWRIRGQIDAPVIGGYIALIVKSSIADMYETGLTNLKTLVETKSSPQ